MSQEKVTVGFTFAANVAGRAVEMAKLERLISCHDPSMGNWAES
jgi:hypothetical protein